MSEIYYNSFFAMGTRFNLVFPSIDYENGDKLFHLVKNEIDRIESLISFYKKESEISRLNNRNTDENIKVCLEVFEILERCKKYYNLTSGRFDITIKPIMDYLNTSVSVSNTGHFNNHLKEVTGFNKVYLDSINRSISFENNYVKIDLGGFGKGYALDNVKALLIEKGVTDAFISFGESSILCLGSHPNGNCWKVGINNLLKPDSIVYSFDVTNDSISTSCNYIITGDKKLHKNINVIDPVNYQSVNSIKSVSVKSESPELAEVLSTAFLVMQTDEIYKVLNDTDKVSAVVVSYDEGFPKLFHYVK